MSTLVARFAFMLAVSATLSVIWLAGSSTAKASHYVSLAQGANAGEYGLNGNYTWAMRTWVIEGQTTRFCVGLVGTERQATFDAIANWESQFAFPFNEFTDECGASQRMDVLDNIGWCCSPCLLPGVIACVEPFWAFDQGRQGYYLNYARIWTNRSQYAFDYNGMRAVMAHELGHVYGLNEAYLHEPFGACNPGIASIMDGPILSSGVVIGGCDGTVVQSYDYSYAHWLNVMNLSNFQPQNLDSQWYSSSKINFFWDDYSPTERYYQIYMRYLWGNAEYTCYVLTFSTNIASGDPWVPTVDRNRTLNHVGCPANTFYRGCLELASGVIGQTYRRCSSNWRYLTS